ncbi:MAG: (d)CMP kinase [Gammaproteobacteria bacterium]|nr:(d)CMP kinase [Gammaproteobacteria bacterium]
MNENTPVITIDGPSGCGKGTIAQLLAKKLGWHFLDSGALYRALGWAMIDAKIDPANHAAIQALLVHLKIEMIASEMGGDAKIIVNNHDVSDEIRSEFCAQMASISSAIPSVRAALLDRQHAMRQLPGLVTDGRDMGTVVFPDAPIKFYFLAGVEERAKRRFNQLKQKGRHVNLPDILRELQVRDERDANRAVAPLKPAADAIQIDTTHLTVEGVFQAVYKEVSNRGF